MACRPGFPPIWAVITIILQYDKGQSEKYLLKKREIHTLKKNKCCLEEKQLPILYNKTNYPNLHLLYYSLFSFLTSSLKPQEVNKIQTFDDSQQTQKSPPWYIIWK